MEDGIDLAEFKNKYNLDFEKEYKNILQKYSDFFEKTNQGYKLTTKGLLVSNNILCEFLKD